MFTQQYRARRAVPLASWLWLAGAGLALAACGGDLTGGTCCTGAAEQSFSMTADATGRTRFRLEGINGNISVVGATNTETVQIDGIRRVEASTQQQAANSLPLLQVRVSETADEVVVRTEQPGDTENRNFIVEYQITVPARLVVEISNLNGNITVDAVDNGVDVGNTNGNITLENIVGNADVDLVNGNIVAEVTPPASGTIELTTVNGNLSLDVPSSVSAELTAILTNGAITVSNLTVQNESSTPTRLTGTLGGGAGEITLATVNGNIAIVGS